MMVKSDEFAQSPIISAVFFQGVFLKVFIAGKPDVNNQIYVISMAEEKGHFEQGRWVAETVPPVQHSTEHVIDKRLADATKSVISSIDDVMKVTHDLITTEEGKQYIDKTMRGMQAELQKSFEEIIRRAKDELNKNGLKGK